MNQLKGDYFSFEKPKIRTILESQSQNATPILTDQEHWQLCSAFARTLLLFDYLNHKVVVGKYNHVSKRMRRMLRRISRQSDFEKSKNPSWFKEWALAEPWGELTNGPGLLGLFDAWEDLFIGSLQELMRETVEICQSALERLGYYPHGAGRSPRFLQMLGSEYLTQTAKTGARERRTKLHGLIETRAQRQLDMLHRQQSPDHSDLSRYVMEAENGKMAKKRRMQLMEETDEDSEASIDSQGTIEMTEEEQKQYE